MRRGREVGRHAVAGSKKGKLLIEDGKQELSKDPSWKCREKRELWRVYEEKGPGRSKRGVGA